MKNFLTFSGSEWDVLHRHVFGTYNSSTATADVAACVKKKSGTFSDIFRDRSILNPSIIVTCNLCKRIVTKQAFVSHLQKCKIFQEQRRSELKKTLLKRSFANSSKKALATQRIVASHQNPNKTQHYYPNDIRTERVAERDNRGICSERSSERDNSRISSERSTQRDNVTIDITPRISKGVNSLRETGNTHESKKRSISPSSKHTEKTTKKAKKLPPKTKKSTKSNPSNKTISKQNIPNSSNGSNNEFKQPIRPRSQHRNTRQRVVPCRSQPPRGRKTISNTNNNGMKSRRVLDWIQKNKDKSPCLILCIRKINFGGKKTEFELNKITTVSRGRIFMEVDTIIHTDHDQIEKKKNQEILSHSIFCDWCGEEYNKKERLPKHLPCFHTFCISCMEKWSDNPIVCPRCSRSTLVPVSLLVPNFTIIEDIEVRNREKTPDNCEMCDDEHLACAQCIQCNQIMCDVMRKAHLKTRLTKTHRVVSLPQISVPFQPPPSLCLRHRLELIFLCSEDNKMICKECLALQHRSHAHISITAAFVKAKKQMLSLLNAARKHCSLLKQTIVKIQKKQTTVSDAQRKVKEEIISFFNGVERAARQRKKSLLAEVDQLIEKRIENLDVKLRSLRSTIASMEGGCQQLQHLLTNEIMVQALLTKNCFEQLFLEFLEENHSNFFNSTYCIKFLPCDPQEMIQKLNRFEEKKKVWEKTPAVIDYPNNNTHTLLTKEIKSATKERRGRSKRKRTNKYGYGKIDETKEKRQLPIGKPHRIDLCSDSVANSIE